MSVSRDVIVDLLPVYLAGEASPATRALVEEHLRQDPALAETVRLQQAENVIPTAAAPVPPELEMRSLRRTRSMMGWQRRLYGFGIGFTAIALTSQMSFKDGRMTDFHFLMRDYPLQFGLFAALAVGCWTGYFLLRRRLGTK